MKKTTILLMILICAGTAWGQTYVPFPTENAQWNVRFSTNPFEFPLQLETTLLQYSLQGDTIINSISYKKVCLNTGTPENPVYVGVGGLRELNKKIYFVGGGYTNAAYHANQQKMQRVKSCASSQVNNTEEFLLYDFNVRVGDVVQWGYEINEISKVDSIKVGQSYRKRYSFRNRNDLIIEGIGSVVNGLLGSMTRIPIGGTYYMSWEHVCFRQNGETVYKNYKFKDCNSTEVNDTESYFGTQSCWSYKATIYEQNMGNFYRTGTANYNLVGDTLINNIVYEKMNFQTGTYDPTGVNNIFIRQENKKIYAISNRQQEEFLLYNFSVVVGDQIISTAHYGEISGRPTVTNVDSIIMYNGEKRKRITVGSDVWIEGIGSIYGFMKPVMVYLTCDCNSTYELISFAKEDHLKFYNSVLCASFNCCSDIIDKIEKVVEDKNLYTVTPNPVSDWLIIKTESEMADCTMEIFDMQGKTVLQKQINMFQNSVNLSSFKNGLYMYRLLQNGKILKAGKVVKM